MKFLKKTNPGEAHKLIFKIPVKNVHDSVFYYYSESNPKQIAKCAMFVMNTLSESKVIDFHVYPLSERTL